MKGLIIDTIGFISDLPHSLMQSFKSTLEEVYSANILLHVRDISNPDTERQKQTVLHVLKSIGIDQKFINSNVIEVWNKIDLVPKLECPDDAIKISATQNINIDCLMERMQKKANAIFGRNMQTLTYAYDEHDARMKWLREHAGICDVDRFDYDYDKGTITIDVNLDEATTQHMNNTFAKNFKKE